MCGGLRCDRLVPKEGPKQVSDGSGEREEEEKVFTGWPKVGRTAGKWTGRVPVGQSGVQEMVDEPYSGLGHAVRQRGKYARLVESIGAERCIQNAKYKVFIVRELPRTV